MEPMISVVMPVYNAMPYLPSAVESVLSQTYSNFEFIIVDDGSTDDSIPYLRDLKDKRILLITSQNNRGYTNRIKQGISLSSGSYIARQDADDISLPERFAHQVAVLEQRTWLAAIFCAFQTIDEHGHLLSTQHPPVGYQAIREMLFYTNPLCHGSVMMRRGSLEAVGGYTVSMEPAEDYDLWLRFSDHFEIGALSDVLYQLRIHTESTTGTRRLEQRRNANKAKVQAFDRCHGIDVSSRTVALHHFSVALHHISEGDMVEGVRRLRLAASADPALDQAIEHMISLTVSLAIELGPSGRSFIRTPEDVRAAAGFLRNLIECLPEQGFSQFRRDVLAEFHAACAFLFCKEKSAWLTAFHILKSWLHSSRHWGNRGLIKLVFRALR